MSNRPKNRPLPRQRNGRGARGRPMLVIVVVLIVLGVVGASVAIAVTGSGSSSNASATASPTASVDAQTKQALLVRATQVSNLNAENLKDVSATKPAATSGQAVLTTQGIVNEVFGQSSKDIPDDTVVYLVQLRGSFKQRQALPAGAPKSAAGETGSVLLMVVSQEYEVIGMGIGNQPVDLSKIGAVVNLF